MLKLKQRKSDNLKIDIIFDPISSLSVVSRRLNHGDNDNNDEIISIMSHSRAVSISDGSTDTLPANNPDMLTQNGKNGQELELQHAQMIEIGQINLSNDAFTDQNRFLQGWYVLGEDEKKNDSDYVSNEAAAQMTIVSTQKDETHA